MCFFFFWFISADVPRRTGLLEYWITMQRERSTRRISWGSTFVTNVQKLCLDSTSSSLILLTEPTFFSRLSCIVFWDWDFYWISLCLLINLICHVTLRQMATSLCWWLMLSLLSRITTICIELLFGYITAVCIDRISILKFVNSSSYFMIFSLCSIIRSTSHL